MTMAREEGGIPGELFRGRERLRTFLKHEKGEAFASLAAILKSFFVSNDL